MKDRPRARRIFVVCGVIVVLFVVIFMQSSQWAWTNGRPGNGMAMATLGKLVVSQRLFTGTYERSYFGDGWKTRNGCDTRNAILQRDLIKTAISNGCMVLSGELRDPYTGMLLQFVRGANTSGAIQIDHVVSLKDAWQKGAHAFSLQRRVELANDPLELIAVDGRANQQKSDGDAADWLPSYMPFRCQYVARQIAVKYKYALTITSTEKEAMDTILSKCPSQSLPSR